MDTPLRFLTPTPKRLEPREGTYPLPRSLLVHLSGDPHAIHFSGEYLAEALSEWGVDAELTAVDRGDCPVTLQVDPALIGQPQGYRLVVDGRGVAVTGGSPAGVFYGTVTLVQLLRLCATPEEAIHLPQVHIRDWPDFPHRGVMLDISRDRVPTLETLLELVDLLAELKVNQLQLYMEHTFAYRGHERVWEKASPLTGEEILVLDAYCQERFVELVPNQNSLGHMHRWLKHEPYRALAEVPEGWFHPFHDEPEPFSLCPTDPGSLELLRDLYDQLLPHFRSRQFNVGLDETWDLGLGRSREVCAQKGTERVYLDFLLQIHREVERRGYTMQFWGDIILHQPQLIRELPQNVIPLEWGYEKDHPFAEHGQQFAEAGLSFYVCPGTSSWNSLAGRTDNALGNLRNAAVNGQRYGAIGYLNTDWGDFGHMQPFPVSFLGYLAGAAYSWNVADAQAQEEPDFPSLLDRHIFRDRAQIMGRLAYDLGNTYRQVGVEPLPNSSPLFWVLVMPNVMHQAAKHPAGAVDRISRWFEYVRAGLDQARFDQVEPYIEQTMARLDQAQMDRPDADLIRDEFRWVADMLRFAARLGQAWQTVGFDRPVTEIPPDVRRRLAQELGPLLERYRELWLARSRPGGLEDSLRWTERLRALLQEG